MVGDGFVGPRQRVGACVRDDAGAGDDREEASGIRAGEVGYGEHRPLAPEKAVGERRDIAHVNTGADDAAALAQGRERQRDEAAVRGEEQGRIERLGRRLARSAGPGSAERAGEVLRRPVPRPRQREHASTLPATDLGDDVGGRPEAVEPDRAGGAGHPQRAPADQPGTQERRRRDRVQARVERDGEGCLRQEVAGEAAVPGAAGEARGIAEILAIRHAVSAAPAGVPEPGHADPRTGRRTHNARADRLDDADDLVAGHDGIDRLRKVAVDDVQIGAADRAGLDPDANLAGPGDRVRPFLRNEGRAGRAQNHRPHRTGLTRASDGPRRHARRAPTRRRARRERARSRHRRSPPGSPCPRPRARGSCPDPGRCAAARRGSCP